MKNKLMLLLLIGIMFLINAKLKAQDVNRFRFGFGVNAGLPLSELKNDYNVGLGADVRFSKGIVKNFDLTLISGIMAFFPKEYAHATITTEAITFIPIKLGGRYMFTKNLYGTAEAGVNFVKNTVAYSSLLSGQYFSFKYETKSQFSYTVGVGARFNNFDIGVRYENVKVGEFLALRLGYDL